jgi:hypothetical protein
VLGKNHKWLLNFATSNPLNKVGTIKAIKLTAYTEIKATGKS